MTFRSDQVEALKAPLQREHIKSRQQAGRALQYVEGWHVIAEANRIFGHDGWDRQTVEARVVCETETTIGKNSQNPYKGWAVTYVAKVRIVVHAGDKDIVREGTGTGGGVDRDLGGAHESAIKEAETDAMKRALITFGWPFGLALYDKTQENVEGVRPSPNGATPPNKAPSDSAAATGLMAQFSDFTTPAQMDRWNSDEDVKAALAALSDSSFALVGAAWKNKRRILAAKGKLST